MSLTAPSTARLQAQLLEAISPLGFSEGGLEKVRRALRISAAVHADASRPDGTPYPDHPLRVALRLLASGAARSASLVVAALLHDAVEDAPEALVEQLTGTAPARVDAGAALSALSAHLDADAARWVGDLTNPDFSGLDAAQKNAAYLAHVVALVDHSPEAFLVKFEDFSENALSLATVTDGARRARLRAKYGPVVRALEKRLAAMEDGGNPVTPHRARMRAALQAALAGEYRDG